MTGTDADPEIEEAAARLADAGFLKTSDVATGSFDDRVLDFVRGSVQIQSLRDRGRRILAVQTPADGIYRGYGDWLSCVTGEKPDLVVWPLVDEVRSLVQHLPRLEKMLGSVDPSTLRECLQATNRWRREERKRQGIESKFER